MNNIIHTLSVEMKEHISRLAHSPKSFPSWCDRHFQCPWRESDSRGNDGRYGKDCKGYECRGNYRHDGMAAALKFQAAMNRAELEKVGFFRKPLGAEPLSKLAAKRDTLRRKLLAHGMTKEAETVAKTTETIRRFTSPTPGRKKGQRAAPRVDGISSRLAQELTGALTGAGIACHGDGDPEGFKLILWAVTVVCGKSDPEKIRNAIRKK